MKVTKEEKEQLRARLIAEGTDEKKVKDLMKIILKVWKNQKP